MVIPIVNHQILKIIKLFNEYEDVINHFHRVPCHLHVRKRLSEMILNNKGHRIYHVNMTQSYFIV